MVGTSLPASGSVKMHIPIQQNCDGENILYSIIELINRHATGLPMSALQYSSSPSSPSVTTTPQSQLYSQSLMSLQPPSSQPVKMSSNTFVHKLYNMVVDKQYQHLIAWNYTGSSFIVCNIMEFSRDVLPKHFKHNNFSSFVRQLNMYGFHKVNKSPRGHRTLAENQIWEFSHAKFLRGRPDLLDDIKRKAMESETLRRETGDLHAHLAMMQVTQNELLQQNRQLQENFAEVARELAETKKRQHLQQLWMKGMLEFLQGQGTPIPFELNLDNFEIKPEPERPPIYITSPENHNINYLFNISHNSITSRPSSPLTINTNNINNHGSSSSQASSHVLLMRQ
ncbi:HSF-type DNA-binding-domain-containing protein [Gigaspora margarita]|uniref:HSF-type DNA-binding-domain-containing protein n=1 Tax=Gigaspora margarita TaxID=4874 RepID=A0A8H4ESU1_GIGMA|nr:HSF-type DNA-binding-domain-containing protein [Gigaspora margarita]